MTTTKNDFPPFLREEALERAGGDAKLLDELLSLYHEEFGSKCRDLAEAIARKDADEIRKLGHGLKGSSANLSLPALREAAWAVEKAGMEGDIEKAREALRRLAGEYDRLKASLG
ncbi:MAG: Hpt domain-containing protein [Candidatus Aminicenantes bacterium]|nr:Hpt domain-containing protein [Candidatus Aminicenantes bacterium]